MCTTEDLRAWCELACLFLVGGGVPLSREFQGAFCNAVRLQHSGGPGWKAKHKL